MENMNELSFEEAMLELEKIVEKLEKGDVPLEKAISYYQEGMQLSKVCNDKLSSVQEKMTKIMNEQDQLESFEIQGDE
ncbi:Exodeoxyribonuclease VII small subunit [Lentibacillus persicus]|uniref:Exodeoxyribonuclease 7 small subunit n=1 Tax=Lentibacillus persicus TaxID=640948 RepID=A0A1I1TBM7_9BACI|nr:exodeoxyribonuclease VII small subunit [Lentibacillus persicus]SFD52850.1 Exodeoxyribonuclease VII small subunit [Lentibacillus persicus]